MLQFEWPYLLLLLPFPWLVRRFMPAAKRQQSALYLPSAQHFLHTDLSSTAPTSKSNIQLINAWLIWTLLLLAASRPVWVGEPMNMPQSGRDLLLAVDISGSMQTEDMNVNGTLVNRLVAVKVVVSDFIEQRKGDRIGLILFGSQAFLQVPLTFDHETVRQMLLESEIGFGGRNTAIGDAIGMAAKHLKDRPGDNSRVLILLTDGANTDGSLSPEQAVEIAKNLNIKIHSIGFGSDEGGNQRGFLGNFNRLFMQQAPTNDIDEEALQSIAATTGGQYYRARSTTELSNIYAELDQLEPIETDSRDRRPRKPLYYWPLALAWLLSLAAMLTLLIPKWRAQNRTDQQEGHAHGQ